MNNYGNLRRLGTLCLLYFVQGAPYGFQTSCLPLILRKQGLSYSQLGALKLLFIPWVCKPFYAPIMEGYKSDLWWLVVSMSTMAVTCLLASLSDDLSLMSLSVTLFILNLSSATQDITVDSVAIKILDPSQLGIGNTIQVVAYKLGAVCVGGSLLWIAESMGHSYMWTVFSCLYITASLLVLSLQLIPPKQPKTTDEKLSFFNLIKNNLGQILRVKNTVWMICFLLFYKLCERGEAVFPIYLVDKKIPLQILAFWNGIVRSSASISGSAFSGSLLSSSRQYKPKSVLVIFASLRIVVLLLQTVLIWTWGKDPVQQESLDELSRDSFLFYVSVATLCIGNFCAGALTTASFTSMMNLSQEAPDEIRSTHYSLLSTVEVLGKLTFATLAGYFIDSLGLVIMYSVFTALAVLTLPILYFMPDKQLVKPE